MAVVLVATGSLAGCDGDGERVSSTEEPSLDGLRNDRWVDLPPSPVGDWDRYNWVFLADRSGFVHAGAATSDGDGKVTSTPAAAYFSFEEGRFTTLPDIPVTGGVGRAGGAWVEDTLVIIGQDCPPSPGFSGVGVEFCAAGGEGAKVVLSLESGATTWREHTLPEWMQEFRQGTPDVLGVLDGKVVVASGHLPAHLGAFDPVTGDWTRLPDAPRLASETDPPPGADPAVASFGAITAQPCIVGDDLVAVMLGEASSAMSFPEGQPPPDRLVQWFRLEEGAFVELPAPITGRITNVACMHDGLLVSRSIDSSALGDTDLSWVDPVAGTAALLDDNAHLGPAYPEAMRFADAALMQPPMNQVHVPDTTVVGQTTVPDSGEIDPIRTYRVATAHGMFDTDLDRINDYVPIVVVGGYAIWQHDLNGRQRTHAAPRIAKLGLEG